jgi:hypothetical protein
VLDPFYPDALKDFRITPIKIDEFFPDQAELNIYWLDKKWADGVSALKAFAFYCNCNRRKLLKGNHCY